MPHDSFDAVIFDFDYTLADSSQGIVQCTNYGLRALGLAEVGAERIYPLVGLSLPDMLVRLYGEAEAGRGQEFMRLFIEHADEVMVGMTRLYDVVPAAIAALQGQGRKLGIVSTKFRYRIVEVMRRESLDHAFGVVIGGEDVAAFKPDPQGLLLATERLGVAPARALYVGDSPTDAQAAQRAAMPFVAVLSGVTPRHDFASYPVYGILESVAALPPFLA